MSACVPRDQKEALVPLKLEFQAVVSCPVLVLRVNCGLLQEHQILLTAKPSPQLATGSCHVVQAGPKLLILLTFCAKFRRVSVSQPARH